MNISKILDKIKSNKKEEKLLNIVNFSVPRSGSTKLSNLFKASCDYHEILDRVNFSKEHPDSFSNRLSKFKLFSNISDKTLFISSQRDFLTNLQSFSRVKSKDNFLPFDKDLCRLQIDNFKNQRKLEIEILKSLLKNQSTIIIYNYKYLSESNNKDLIKQCIKILDEFINYNNIKRFANSRNNLDFNSLEVKYALNIDSAKKIQSKMKTEFESWDQETGIHGNHIFSGDTNDLLEFEKLVDSIGFNKEIREKEDLDHFNSINDLIEAKKNSNDISNISKFIS